VNEKKLMVPTNVASAFNNFFVTVTENFNNLHIQSGGAISILNYSFHRTSPA
jgi:hypothetical protein